MSHRLLDIVGGGLLFCAGCVGPGADFDSRYLETIGIAGSPEARSYPMEEFFKTSRITSFAFRPDGQGVYCIKHDEQVPNVFVYDLAENNMRQVTAFNTPVKAYRVDPQGRYLYVQKDENGNEQFDILRLNLDSGRVEELVSGGEGESCHLGPVSANGDALVFLQTRHNQSQSEIKMVDVASGGVSTVLSMENAYLGISAFDAEAGVLVFTRTVENNERHLGVYDLNAKEWFFVEDGPGIKSGPGRLVDGKLYYLSNRGSNTQRIWKYDLARRTQELLSPQPSSSIDRFEVFGEGTNQVTVVYAHWDDESNIKVYDGVFGAERELPLTDGELYGVVFDSKEPSRGVLIRQECAQPLKYYVFKGPSFRLMYDANQSQIRNHEFARTMMIFVRSYDGLMIPTVLVIPKGTSRTHPRPVMFWIHGGPEDHVSVEYSGVMQYLANNGFIVVAPNVRGSSGLGKSYRMLDNGDWGGRHIEDILAVASFMQTRDFVQPNNMFIMGGSFGGFSVVSMIEQYPHVFNAAIDMFGLIEMASFVDSWPSGLQQYWLNELGNDPRKDKEFNQRISPLYHAEKIQIPLQVHQGANDPRVPREQSEMLVARLEELEKPVEYYLYPEAGHGFATYSDSRLCYQRIIDFCKKHTFVSPAE